MSPRNTRRALIGAVAATAVLGAPALASACSKDNATWLESFVDQSCLVTPLVNTTLDAQGGLRLTTSGTPTPTAWQTDTHFTTGITHDTKPFGKVGLSTLAVNGTGDPAALELPATVFPLAPTSASVLGPTASAVPDGDHVDSPSVVKTPAGYVMFYVGLAEDGSDARIFRATSADGKSWTRAATPNVPVLAGTPGSFDEMGVSGPHVIFDAADAAAPYKMYYAGQGRVFGSIGFATSTDGITWTKRAEPVLSPGRGGSADSFAAADPWVIKDGVIWKMWYTADDSNQRRIAYATSTDGLTWSKGGAVVNPGSPAIMQDDAFAPAVWKTGTGFTMMFGGYNAGSGSSQTKLVNATSSDGISWSGFGTAMPLAGGSTRFDTSNLSSPTLLDEGVAGADRYKLYYSGNSVDANGNAHWRIGLATGSNGTSFNRFTPASPANASVLDIAALGTRFDARSASGLSVMSPTDTASTPKFVGFYAGQRGIDATWRIGQATSTDGETWSKTDGADATMAAFSLAPAGPDTAQDDGGALDPAGLLNGTTYNLYYTGLDSAKVQRIFRTTAGAGTGNLPGSWSAPTASTLVGDGSGFDAGGVSHPSVIKDGANFVMYYTGQASGQAPEIGRVSSTTADLATAPVRSASPVVAKGAVGTFDEKGAKDPVVVLAAAGDYRMTYTAIGPDGVERLAYATSADGTTWSKKGVVLNPSLTGFGDDEVAVGASGMVIDGADVHVYTTRRDRTGRQFGGHALESATATQIPMGYAAYQMGDSTTTIRDWRSITRTSTGANVELWLSFLQPYQIAGQDAWSDYFPVTQLSATETLNLLLTVKAVRWQARLSDPASNPVLDTVSIDTAPVQFNATGSATTLAVEPPSTMTLGSWGNLVVTTETLSPAGTGTVGGTVEVRNADTDAQIAAPFALVTNGTLTVNLSAVSAATNPRLKLVFALTSSGAATPLIKSASVAYTAAAAGSTPAPAPAPAPAPPKDTTAPINVAITGPTTLSKPFQVAKVMTLAWTGTDAESAVSYALNVRVAPIGGAFGQPTAVTLAAPTATTAKVTLTPGSTYCWTVTATSAGGSTKSAERCTALPLHSYGLTAKGTWAKKTGTGYYLSRYRVGKAKGASLLRTGVTAKRISLVATRAKGAGTVTVWFGTTKLKTVKLAYTATRKRQVIPIIVFTKVKKGTIKVRVETSGKPVIIEGLAVSKV